MNPPLVSFVTWNRLGLTDRNLRALLGTADDFELYLADSNSTDGTWEYLQELKDPRIKSMTRFDANRGPVYAANYHLSKRKKGQYFITVDNDVNIHTHDWISKFLETFRIFPEAGLLGAVSSGCLAGNRQPLVKRERNGICYLQITKGYVEGCCQCLRPELLDLLGYWNEECCTGDLEICRRICHFTPYTAGYLPAVEIDQQQFVLCGQCGAKDHCMPQKDGSTCFFIHRRNYRNPQFRNQFLWKYDKFVKELEDGRKKVYCASVHDPGAIERYGYDRPSAEENFRYYMEHANR